MPTRCVSISRLTLDIPNYTSILWFKIMYELMFRVAYLKFYCFAGQVNLILNFSLSIFGVSIIMLFTAKHINISYLFHASMCVKNYRWLH